MPHEDTMVMKKAKKQMRCPKRNPGYFVTLAKGAAAPRQ
jgi:hypothetical protein